MSDMAELKEGIRNQRTDSVLEMERMTKVNEQRVFKNAAFEYALGILLVVFSFYSFGIQAGVVASIYVGYRFLSIYNLETIMKQILAVTGNMLLNVEKNIDDLQKK